MEVQYSSNGKGNLGVTLGAIGTGLSILNGGLGLLGNGNNTEGGRFVTKDELDMSQRLAEKDSTIALLKSEADTENKITTVYEKITTRLLDDERRQQDWNATQMVFNSGANSAISVLQSQVGVLNGLTKTVIPNGNVCPGWGAVSVVPTVAATGTTFA